MILKNTNVIRQVIYLVSFSFLFIYSGAGAQEKVLTIDSASFSEPLGRYVYLFEDKQSFYTDSEVMRMPQFRLEN